MDIRPLASAGICSFDPGFANTAGCAVGHLVDRYRKQHLLLHRGYPVDQLARQCDFLEVAWILLRGDAPDEASYQAFKNDYPP
jgi:citrate synthase